MNLPNKLTLLRVLMIPAFLIVLLVVPYPVGPLVAAAIYAIASATDAIDGNLARKYNMVTDFGKFWIPWPIKCWSSPRWCCCSIWV